jgi:hypothetical protein
MTITVDGSPCELLWQKVPDRAIVAIVPGIYVVAIRLGDGTWTAEAGEPGNDDERAKLARLVAATPDSLEVTSS